MALPPDDSSQDETDPPPQRVELHIPAITFGKCFAAALVALAAYKLWSLLLLVFLAILVAVTLNSMVDWLMTRGLKRRGALILVLGCTFLLIGVGSALVVPALLAQIGSFSERWPTLQQQLLQQFKEDSFIRQSLEHAMANKDWTDLDALFGRFLTAGGIAFTGVTQLILLLMISLYLVIDGGRTYRWLLAFFPPFTRRKMYQTSEEISLVIFRYVVGQAITSGLIMIYAFIVLSLLHVPGALMLAILAAVFDILPMLGFFFLTTPAFLLALTVSPRTAFTVLALYLIYVGVESYFIVPKIYGKSLRLSTLSVLLGLLVGTILAGIPGALAALPLVASYSVIERIWLKHYLGEGVSEKHELQKDKEFGEKT